MGKQNDSCAAIYKIIRKYTMNITYNDNDNKNEQNMIENMIH